MLKRHPRQFAPQFDITPPILFAQAAADCGLSAACDHDINPCGLGALTFGGHNLDRLAIFQACPKRHANAINLGPHARMANARVNRIGEIQRGRPTRQLHNIPFRREAKHLVGIHFQLHMFEEFIMILGHLKAFCQRGQPFCRINRKRVRRAHPVSIGPMRRDTRFSNFVHLARADLDFNTLAISP